MRVFVTGATGFVGSHLSRLLLREGCEVHALVREGSDLRRIQDLLPVLHQVRCDLMATEELAAQLERIRPDLCIHLAWYAVPGKYLNAVENLAILNASLNLALRLASLGCARFVGVGSCFEYDMSLGYLFESSPAKPRSLYAATKLAFNLLLEQLENAGSMKVTWLRFFYLYGPSEDERRLVPAVICSLLRNQAAKTTKGEQIRDFLHVEDVAAAIWAIIQSELTGVVNIGSGKPVAVRQIVETIGDILRRPELLALGSLPYGASDPMFVCANNRRLVENTRWTQQYTLEDGLRHTVQWWREHLH